MGFGGVASKLRGTDADTFRLVRDVPVERGFDLVVAGGGPAGAAAAICAARLNARVLLVDEMQFLGGVATAAWVPFVPPLSNHEVVFVGGLYREILDSLFTGGFVQPSVKRLDEARFRHWFGYNPEGLKLVLDDLAQDAGVELRFATRVIDAEVDSGKNTVRGVILSNIEGYRYVEAKAFVDATGDAVLAHLCGAECREVGRDAMPPTLVSAFAGIDYGRFNHAGQCDGLERALADGHFSQADRHLSGMMRIGETTACLNGGHIFDFDSTRCGDLTAGAIRGRKIAREYYEFFRKYVPGCENIEQVATAPKIGVRESRRVVGEYTLDVDDFLAWREFPDQIAVHNYPIDIHVKDSSEADYQRFLSEYKAKRETRGRVFGLPYGILVPRGWTNLWTAGRCASSDVKVHSSIRIQACCAMMGQAAGTAAVQSIRTGRPAAELDTSLLVDTLRRAGAYLPQKETSGAMTRG